MISDSPTFGFIQYMVMGIWYLVLLVLCVYQLFVEQINPKKVGALVYIVHRATFLCGTLFFVACVLFCVSETNDETNFAGLVMEDLGVVVGIGFFMLIVYQTFATALASVKKDANSYLQRTIYTLLFCLLFTACAIKNAFMLYFNSTVWQDYFIFVVVVVIFSAVTMLWVSFFELHAILSLATKTLQKSAADAVEESALDRFKKFALILTSIMIVGASLDLMFGIIDIQHPRAFYGFQNNSSSFGYAACCAGLVFSWATFYAWRSPLDLAEALEAGASVRTQTRNRVSLFTGRGNALNVTAHSQIAKGTYQGSFHSVRLDLPSAETSEAESSGATNSSAVVLNIRAPSSGILTSAFVQPKSIPVVAK